MNPQFHRLGDARKAGVRSIAALEILIAVRHMPHTCTGLAAAINASPAGLTDLVDTLTRAGMVERVRCAKDRRIIRVCITQRGIDLHDLIFTR